MRSKLFVRVDKDMLPRQEDRHPFLYFEHSRLEVDEGSIKVVSADEGVYCVPVAMASNVLVGPGCSITTEAIKVIAGANCSICWVAEDSFRFFAGGRSPTDHTKSSLYQLSQYCDLGLRLEVARRMFRKRFPAEDLSGMSLRQMMGMEGSRVRYSYKEYSEKYNVEWTGRNYNYSENALDKKFVHGSYVKAEGDLINRLITLKSQVLYALVHSYLFAMGFLPQVGFIHSGSPLPFVYDIADLYKDKLVIEPSFQVASRGLGEIPSMKETLSSFSTLLQTSGLLRRIPEDVWSVLGRSYGSSDC